MRVQVWYNLNSKQHEATPLQAGRPFKEHSKDRKSKRLIVSGETREAAVEALLKEIGFVPADCLK